MTAVSATDGKTLWTAPHPPSGYDSPEDLFVINDQVWCAPLSNKRHSGLFLGYDLKTGVVKSRYPDTTGAHMPHHRCHRAKATEKYILTSRTGLFASKKEPPLGKMQIVEPKPMGRKRTVPTPGELWSSAVPVLVRAMVLTPDTLFVAGLSDVLDEKKLNDNLNDPALRAKAAEQSEAWLGRKGGVLLAVSPGDGRTLARHKLAAPPVFDGMAAANQRLFISLEDGAVVCLGR